MKYREITADASNRFQLPSSHPYLAEIVIDPVDWAQFERLDGQPGDSYPATTRHRRAVVIHEACARRNTAAFRRLGLTCLTPDIEQHRTPGAA
jgi:hypothetical protein